MQFVSKL
jgi:alkane 1-monooxygenase